MAADRGFIYEVAQALHAKYGDDISSLHVLFPSKRARLFFAQALAQITNKPIWQPTYTSIDEIMEDISGLSSGDRIRLVTELYTVYSQFHSEPFDSFYFWGETLLSDFDSVDKYLIDTAMLFTNIADLKSLEDDLSYLEPEQIEIITRFWRSFGQGPSVSQEQKKFLDIWHTLKPIYNNFKAKLTESGIAYTGMLHRAAAEKIKSGQTLQTEKRRYVIAGFNALTKCEQVLFEHLSKNHEVDFFWDYDHYYIDNAEQEAGLFLRDNIVRFPQKITTAHTNRSFSDHKNITVVESPSDSLQCKYTGEAIHSIIAEQNGRVGKETAIVLTDENLLLPVLYSIPDKVDDINVTMGYPLRNSLEYSFAERLIQLQSNKRSKSGKTSFHHNDVSGLLTHPFLADICGNNATTKNTEVVSQQRVYVESSIFGADSFMQKLFNPVEGWVNMADYINGVLSDIAIRAKNREDAGQRIEFLNIITETVTKLQKSLEHCNIELSERIFASLLRRMLQSLSIPYQGEPLSGLQVMGILETRNLDFENVILLSVNDDTFPGNRTSPSFIPHNLKLAYGLPTPSHHEGVFAYYFYRLLQRAKNIHIVYCSRSDDKSTGEQSRYLYQLAYESPHHIERKTIGVDANLAPAVAIVIQKEKAVIERLEQFTLHGERKLSPTAFYNYIQCPLKFYFYSIARLRKENQMSEDVDTLMFGTILHRAMELLYAPFVGRHSPREDIRALIGSGKTGDAVGRSINEEYLRESSAKEEDYNGNLLLIKDIVTKYINKCILPYDSSLEGHTVKELEKELGTNFDFHSAGRNLTIKLMGKADRTDVTNGGTLQVIDYKTGASHVEFNGIASMFEPQTHKNVSGAVLQTFMYAMMLYKTEKSEVQPALYYVREMNAKNFSPLLLDKSSGSNVERYSDYAQEFEKHLSEAFSQIYDPSVPFSQCEDRKICQYCDFREICRR